MKLFFYNFIYFIENYHIYFLLLFINVLCLRLSYFKKKYKLKIMFTPKELLNNFPLQKKNKEFIKISREEIKKIHFLKNKIIVIVGPCSIHSKKDVVEYAKNLKALIPKINKNIFIVMRCFSEKARSSKGWKGYLYNPYLEKKDDIKNGLTETRKLLLEITNLKIPICAEILIRFL